MYLPHMILSQSFPYINGLVQDCSNSIALAMELLQSCTKPMKWYEKTLISNYIKRHKSIFSQVKISGSISKIYQNCIPKKLKYIYINKMTSMS